jgi:ATP-dependent DNA helicase RecQ
LLFYSWNDFLQYKKFIESGDGNEEFQYVQNAKLNRMWEFANSSDCRTNVVLSYFGEYKNKGCGHCDNCKYPPKKFDGLILAQKAISAVIRSGEKIAMSLLIDVLRGSHRQEVVQYGLHQIKTFGAGKDLSFAEWREYLTQIIDKGYLMIDYKNNLRIRTTPLARAVLEKKSTVMLKKYETPTNKEATVRTRVKKKTKLELLEEHLSLELKNWRKQKADELNIAPYQLISDLVMDRIVKSKPTFIYGLKSIEGIGKEAVNKYGKDLLSFLQSFFVYQEHKKNLKGKTYLETLLHYKDGKTPIEIAELKGVHLYTIYSHFAYLYNEDEEIDLSPYINQDQVDVVKKIIEERLEDDELVLRNHLPEGFSVYLIRMAKAIIAKGA